MHVPTGLFVQGHYNHVDYNAPFNPGTAGYWATGNGVATEKPAAQWLIQGGVSKNWFGLGNTSVYGEYGVATDWGAASAGRAFAATANTTGFTAVAGVTGTEMTVTGFGLVQRVDAAATDLYLGYRHFDADIKCNTANCGAAATGATAGKLPTESLDVVVMGARMQF